MRTTILPLLTSLALTGAAFAAEAPKPIAKAAAPVQPAAKPAADADMMMGGEMMMMGGKTAEFTPEQLAFFESKIRPILKETCYKCHSVESGKSKGGLLLDTREATLKGGDTGPAVKPGDTEKSLLLKAISYKDPDLQMPPKGEKLNAEQIAAFTQWVKMGAPDPRKSDPKASKLSGLTDKARSHWSFKPVQKPAIPEIKNRGWYRTPVDAFVLAKLESKNMLPMPDTTKEALLRRATFDLLGLPPTPAELREFLSDQTPTAFQKAVERLLASPHYGERWGRFWLDTARYADTIGGDRNANNRADYRYPFAYTYRDWVIKAFNSDMPYDKFITAQLAADKMPESQKDKSLLAGLGFLTVGERFGNNNDVINDRIDAVTKGFVGLTVSCARCHDHMFDPIPTKDYYALHGVFASITEPLEKPTINSPAPARTADFTAKLAALEQQNRDVFYKAMDDTTWLIRQQAGTYLLAGEKGRDNASETELLKREALVKEAKLDNEMINYVRGRARKENAVFGPWRMFADLSDGDFAFRCEALCKEIAEGKDGKGSKYNSIVATAFRTQRPKSMEDLAGIYDAIFKSVEPRAKEFWKAAAESKDGKYAGFDDATAQLIGTPFRIEPATKLDTETLREAIGGWPNQLGNRTKFVFPAVNELYLTHDGAPARAMIVSDKPRAQDSQVFIRGQAETRGDVVPRRFLDVLAPGGKAIPFKEGSGRLELAKTIANKQNPLTARVLVNRVWMHHFGEGFVRTPDDLGTQAEAPSHPELLDYLSWYFMEQGWSVKNLHRMIMNSHVYQITSDTRKEYETVDPENRMLWRANIRRLDFEAMRDSLLVYSGKLDRTLAGQPVNLTDEPYSYRRSVYGYIDRGNVPELMSNFDFSDPDMPNSKRTTTVVPQQALFLMNSAMSIDVARRVVARPDVAGRTDALGKVIAIYAVVFQRQPRPDEIRLAYEFLGIEQKADVALPAETKAAMEKAGKEKQAALAKRVANKGDGRDGLRAIQNEGTIVERKALDPWETYTQALLLSNEAAYVN